MVKVIEKEKTGKPRSNPALVSKEELEVAAYFHWLNRGCPSNDDLTDWIEAEKEYRAELQSPHGKKGFEKY